jgi:hypothetical protein
VRKQGVVLEDGVHVAVVGRQARDIIAVKQDSTGSGEFEAGDHAEAGGLAGT